MQRLESEEPALPKWEQETIGDTEPLLKAVAEEVQATIDFARREPLRMWTPAFRASAEQASHDTDLLNASLREHLAQSKSREKH
jgi:hypothetical protein